MFTRELASDDNKTSLRQNEEGTMSQTVAESRMVPDKGTLHRGGSPEGWEGKVMVLREQKAFMMEAADACRLKSLFNGTAVTGHPFNQSV